MENFKPLSEYLDSLPEPNTLYEKFLVWISDLIDDYTIWKMKRRTRCKFYKELKNESNNKT